MYIFKFMHIKMNIAKIFCGNMQKILDKVILWCIIRCMM